MSEQEKEQKPNGHILSLEEMLEAENVDYVTVPVPEWKGSVRFASVSAGTMMEFVEHGKTPSGNKNSNIWLIVRSLVDEKGERLVKGATEQELDAATSQHIEKFKKKDVRIMNRLMDAVLKLNDITVTKAEVKNVLSEAAGATLPTVLH